MYMVSIRSRTRVIPLNYSKNSITSYVVDAVVVMYVGITTCSLSNAYR